MFELVEYENLGKTKIPLIVGFQNNNVWSFKGVLTETSEIKVTLFEALAVHFEETRALYETQCIFSIKGDESDNTRIFKLMALYLVEGDDDPVAPPDVPQLPVFYIEKDRPEDIITCFDGTHDFHANYPEFTKDLIPLVTLAEKFFK